MPKVVIMMPLSVFLEIKLFILIVFSIYFKLCTFLFLLVNLEYYYDLIKLAILVFFVI